MKINSKKIEITVKMYIENTHIHFEHHRCSIDLIYKFNLNVWNVNIFLNKKVSI